MSNKFKTGDRVEVVKDYDFVKVGMIGTIIRCNAGGNRNVVMFDRPFEGGHDCAGEARNGYGQYVPDDCLKLVTYDQEVVITTDHKKTLARLYDGNKFVKSASAKCSPDDEFIFEIGAKLALDRLFHKEFPKEVKRPAKVGEYIKMVNAVLTGGYYTNGDVFKVTAISPARLGAVYFDVPGRFHVGYAWESEYVVLEGYAQEEHKSEEKSEFYTGKIVCIDDCGYSEFYTVGKIYNVVDGEFNSDNSRHFGPYSDLNHINEINGAKFLEIKE